MDFHVITPRGPILLFSVDSGRIVSSNPDPGEPLASSGSCATSVTTSRAELEDHAADDAKVDASVV